ncbi:GNAT family N-acetyltransferase [Paenibacillus contaminans]|uniref:RimJ/RimL family protein N-acetyltransferase n=1 Tax=Paenibacillus contaminans TaxID=450362 RepID=A0A329MZ03_9BACL|nr:GNAT family protein [Paenibacillus contaminans]RAV23423.1 RimJ/RimL family protein N-acetyltransferase [Paenibacillus contaminans]
MFSYTINDHVSLRLLEIRDAESLHMLISGCKPYLQQWLPWAYSQHSVDSTQAFIRASLAQFAANDGFQAGIWYDNQIAGVIGFHRFDWMNRTTSIGYWLGEPYQGLGIMTNACRTLVHFAFATLGMNRVEIECAVENVKSRAIPERLGFMNEGRRRQREWLQDRYVDHIMYGILASEWLAENR